MERSKAKQSPRGGAESPSLKGQQEEPLCGVVESPRGAATKRGHSKTVAKPASQIETAGRGVAQAV